MQLNIKHATRYRFESPVAYGLQQLRKTPKSTHQQRVLSWATTIIGGKKELSFEDHHNNTVELLSFERDADEMVVTSEGKIEISETHGVLGPHLGPAPLWLYQHRTDRTKPGAGVRNFLRDIQGDDILPKMHDLLKRIGQDVTYELGASESDWSAEDAISAGKGVCQDHAHIFISCAREMGLPARYVSGYLLLDGRVEQDAMHAWSEVFIEGLGWVGFDASNGISPDTRYVRVATGLDYSDAAPVTGTRIGGLGEVLTVDIEVAEQ